MNGSSSSSWSEDEPAPNSDSGTESKNSSSSVASSDFSDKSEYDADANTLTDLRDGKVYRTVVIGDGATAQTWMAENLNYDPGNVSDMSDSAWHGCYNDEISNCAKYGRLYTWDVAMNDANCALNKACNPTGNIRGVCPNGWHLPSKAELETLFANLYSGWQSQERCFVHSLLKGLIPRSHIR